MRSKFKGHEISIGHISLVVTGSKCLVFWACYTYVFNMSEQQIDSEYFGMRNGDCDYFWSATNFASKRFA